MLVRIWPVLLTVLFFVGFNAVSAHSAGPPTSFPGNARGQAAIAKLGDRLPDVAARYGFTKAQLKAKFLRDFDLALDPSDRLLYLCGFGLPGGIISQGTAAEGDMLVSQTSYPLDVTFALHSRPGASKIIYLDFNGHLTTESTWTQHNNGQLIDSQPLDLDGDSTTFSDAERELIQNIWLRVVEDYSMYDVDVTTEDPGVEALRKTSGDEIYGVRAVISPTLVADFSSSGGVAYIGSFDDSVDLAAFIFSSKLGPNNEKFIAEAISHEVGHSLGLNHDGKTDGTVYYAGHGNWAPIMGNSYYKAITQWSKGEYAGANNSEDDLARILNFGPTLSVDYHGDTIDNAVSLVGTNLSGSGIIEQRDDVDVFSFVTGDGDISISVNPAPRDVDLDISLQLLDSNGYLIAEVNETNNSVESLSINLPAGVYYLVVDGVGTGDPTTGYSDYSTLGQYTLTGVVQPTNTSNVPAFKNDPIVEIEATEGSAYYSSIADNAFDLDGDTLSFSIIAGPAWLTIAANGTLEGVPSSDDIGLNSWTVEVADNKDGTDTAALEIYVNELVTFVEQVATADIVVAGTLAGTFVSTQLLDGSFESITEKKSGGKPSNRYSYLDHRWTFDVPSGVSTIFYANIWAPRSLDGDTFVLSYSTDNVNYHEMFTVAEETAGSTYQQYMLPADLSGTVYVKLTDTDSIKGNLALDTVYIDHICIQVDMLPGDPPIAPSGLTVLSTSNSNIELAWLDSSTNEVGFIIERSIDGGASWLEAGTVGADIEVFINSGLSPDTNYSYRVQSYNGSGNSGYSGVASALTASAAGLTIGLVDSSALGSKPNRWDAAVILSASSGALPVAGVTVSGVWSNGVTGNSSCVTGVDGSCQVTKSNLKTSLSTLTFTVSDVEAAGYSYVPGLDGVDLFVP
ncbi:MAG: hypothetical protein ACI8PB_005151 [Desulforhopalus sp.]|jgi:hypothetical protein